MSEETQPDVVGVAEPTSFMKKYGTYVALGVMILFVLMAANRLVKSRTIQSDADVPAVAVDDSTPPVVIQLQDQNQTVDPNIVALERLTAQLAELQQSGNASQPAVEDLESQIQALESTFEVGIGDMVVSAAQFATTNALAQDVVSFAQQWDAGQIGEQNGWGFLDEGNIQQFLSELQFEGGNSSVTEVPANVAALRANEGALGKQAVQTTVLNGQASCDQQPLQASGIYQNAWMNEYRQCTPGEMYLKMFEDVGCIIPKMVLSVDIRNGYDIESSHTYGVVDFFYCANQMPIDNGQVPYEVVIVN